MYWIINDNIEFWPEHRKLISVHNADLNVVLTTPASRCLWKVRISGEILLG
ncbi:transcriptional regulator [Escherichia coli]|nr:transcriptional regulator [Escherichia coli]